MKKFNLLSIIILGLVLLNACGKDALADGNLTGTWSVTKVEGQQFVNGTPGINLQDNNPSGYIKFN